MAASSTADPSLEISMPLKIPKTEVPSPESEEYSDSNQYHSNPPTPNRFSPLNVGSGSAGRTAASSSNSFTACRGMSWTPAETNALIAVWGNERLAEARMQQLEVAGTVFSGKAPGPAMYERVSRALMELGYDRTPSQCRERMKVDIMAMCEKVSAACLVTSELKLLSLMTVSDKVIKVTFNLVVAGRAKQSCMEKQTTALA